MSNHRPVCLITGGASGIGAACAQLFVQAGYHVTIADIQQEKGEALAAELGPEADYASLNVREEADFERVIGQLLATHGRLDCLVNNAAIVGTLGPISEIPLEEFEYTQSIILRSVFLGLKHAARAMGPQGCGSIVNIASVAGLTAGYGPHLYNTCKAGVVQITKSVALELIEQGIRVNAVCPGNVETPIHTGVTDERWLRRMEKIRIERADDQPQGRMAVPSEIAEAVLWLASERASYVTGHAMVVDGGLMAGMSWRDQPAYLREFHPAKR